MKVYRFYKRPEYDSLYHEYRLYALTNKKEYAKMFRETRNMNIFAEKSSKVSKDEWKSIIDDSEKQKINDYDEGGKMFEYIQKCRKIFDKVEYIENIKDNYF